MANREFPILYRLGGKIGISYSVQQVPNGAELTSVNRFQLQKGDRVILQFENRDLVLGVLTFPDRLPDACTILGLFRAGKLIAHNQDGAFNRDEVLSALKQAV